MQIQRELRAGETQHQFRIGRVQAPQAGTVQLRRLLIVAAVEALLGQTAAVVERVRDIELARGLALAALGVDAVVRAAQRLSRPAAVAQIGQHLGDHVDGDADVRARQQDEQPVAGTAGAHRMHGAADLQRQRQDE